MKRSKIMRTVADLHGISFVAKIRIEPSTNPGYGDSNRIERVVLPNEPEWQKVMNGETVPPAPNHRPARASQPKPAPQPAWNQPAAAPATTQAAKPAWAAAPVQQQPAASQPAKSAGPAWLNG